jgi:Protein of unknown function (DUF2961)
MLASMRGMTLVAIVVAGCGDNLAGPMPPASSGYDAYRDLAALPRIRIGDRAYMRSTYDRSGGNEGADASHFIRQEADGTLTTLDVAGTGVLVFARTNHWHGSPWHEVIDGVDHVIAETSTATPDTPAADPQFIPSAALPAPLAITWPQTRGSDLDWVPKTFASSLRISDERTHYGTGYYIFHTYADSVDLSSPIASWDEAAPPPDVLDLFARAGTDIAPPGRAHGATIDIPADGTVPALVLEGPAVIRKLSLDAAAADAVALADVRLTITWDDRPLASVDAPIGLLFAGGALYNRDARAALVASLFANVTFDADRVHLALYFPMPFQSSARIALSGAGHEISSVQISASTLDDNTPPQTEGYFHASYVDHSAPIPGQDLVLLDTTQLEDSVTWCGSFVGTSFTFSDRAVFDTLEGDPRFFFDDARSPQGHGTGTEEWAGGGDYFGGQTDSLPLAGHPTGAPSLADVREPADAVESAYRFLLADAMPFGRNARIQLEHGGTDNSDEHYRSVAYWYGRPSACLVPSDSLHVGDPADEAAHTYVSSTASAPISITSRWDGLGGDVENPVETDTGRTMTGTSSFRFMIDPNNRGALLRRTLDYAIADQRAEVWISDDHDGAPFVRVGTWYVAGSTTTLYSNPPGELDVATPTIEVIDRRFKDDEFLLPRALTEGRTSLRIEVRSVAPMWSELRYALYSYVR